MALASIQGDNALDELETVLQCGLPGADEPLATIRGHAVLGLRHCNKDKAKLLAKWATADPHPEVAALARTVLSTTNKRILFVCAGNTCRSPMAVALARPIFHLTSRIESAGTSASSAAPPSEDAVQAMKERGIDVSAHKSRPMRHVNLDDFDIVVALTPSIAQALRTHGADASKLRTLDIPDPFGKGLETYRDTAQAIERELASFATS